MDEAHAMSILCLLYCHYSGATCQNTMLARILLGTTSLVIINMCLRLYTISVYSLYCITSNILLAMID